MTVGQTETISVASQTRDMLLETDIVKKAIYDEY